MSPAPTLGQQVLHELAPHGTLRVAINFGNIVLAQRGAAGEPPAGISVDIARELGRTAGLPVELVTYDAAGKVFDALGANAWDVAFLAIEPARGEKIAFTPAYLHIEGAYLVRADAPYRQPADLDRAGVRIAVGVGSAYDLFLSRTLQQARIERHVNAAAAYSQFQDAGLEAVAGIRQVVDGWAAAHESLRVIEESFMAIRQAMGVPIQNHAAAAFLSTFIENMKADGRIAHFIQRNGQSATIAPAGR